MTTHFPRRSSNCARFAIALATIAVALLIPELACADSWTNRAGHVLTARLIAIQGDHVILQSTNTKAQSWRLPLASLKPADQQRAREQTGTVRLPSELQACLNQAEQDIHRAAQFLHGGRITPEQYAARCRKIQESFEGSGRQALMNCDRVPVKASLDSLLILLEHKATSLKDHL